MRTLRVWNETGKALGVRIEPCAAHYELASGAIVEMTGFDPAEEVLDAIVRIDPEGATVTFRSANEIAFLAAERFSFVNRGYLWRMGEYLRRQLDTSRSTTMRIENKTDRTLGLWVEPNPDYYHLPARQIAELRGFDPKLDRIWDFSLHVRPEERFVSVGPFGEITPFVEGQPLPNVPI